MSNIRRAKITVYLDRDGVEASKYFTGTEQEVLMEAHDWTYEFACRYINKNDIDDVAEQVKIIEGAGHTITWDDGPVNMYAVVNTEAYDGDLLGVFANRADAEEAIFTECEDWPYEVIMTDDPIDLFGREWNYAEDYRYLMRDCARVFSIVEVPVFDVKEVK